MLPAHPAPSVLIGGWKDGPNDVAERKEPWLQIVFVSGVFKHRQALREPLEDKNKDHWGTPQPVFFNLFVQKSMDRFLFSYKW